MTTRLQVIVRTSSSRDIREFHVSELVSELHYARFVRPQLQMDQERFSALGRAGEVVVKTMLDESDEIEKIVFRPFSVGITKIPTATWDKVTWSVIHALAKGFDRSEDELDIIYEEMASLEELRIPTLMG